MTITVEDKVLVIDDEGTELQAMTFNRLIPSPLMVVPQDDYVELTLITPDSNSMPHKIDFHAATGALGGGEWLARRAWRSSAPRLRAAGC